MEQERTQRRDFLKLTAAALGGSVLPQSASSPELELAGMTVTPHLQLSTMRYRREPEPAHGARLQLFLRRPMKSSSSPLRIPSDARLLFAGKSPAEWLVAREWAWHDTPAALKDNVIELPAGAMTVWTINGRTANWGPGGSFDLELGPRENPWLLTSVDIAVPRCWQSAVTFLAAPEAISPETMIVHLANESDAPVKILSCRLWTAANRQSPRVLFPQPPFEKLAGFAGQLTIPSRDKGGFTVKTGPLPLTYSAVEIVLAGSDRKPFSIWSHLRIKPERFDISGGWVNSRENHLTREVFLKTLKLLHINTAHIGEVRGYTDTELYQRYPLKYFNKLQPFDQFDTDTMLPRIHAVEFLGEPQYGGGRPVPPQEVWEKLAPYATTRLATSVTHSEERIWRDYAGLSDYPHYDAYRVTAPSADDWRKYDRWGGRRIGWGAPLETIGDMCRSLRELNRPMPCAYWSQGPHEGWDVYDGRKRTSPTPAEIRSQAYHAVSTRITSLYWFNLSLKSLVGWRDTLDQLGRIGRELRMIEDLLLESDAYRHQRLTEPNGRDGEHDWDLASVCGPRAALLFALDLKYRPDPVEKVFRFGPPREAVWRFQLPGYLNEINDVFRMDADGLTTTDWKKVGTGIEIRDRLSLTGIYIATPSRELRPAMERKRRQLLDYESVLGIDPARVDDDFNRLAQLL